MTLEDPKQKSRVGSCISSDNNFCLLSIRLAQQDYESKRSVQIRGYVRMPYPPNGGWLRLAGPRSEPPPPIRTSGVEPARKRSVCVIYPGETSRIDVLENGYGFQKDSNIIITVISLAHFCFFSSL